MKMDDNTKEVLKTLLHVIAWILILLILSTSCITQQKCFERFPPNRDTTYIEKVREINVPVPGDTVNLIVPIKCPDQDVAVMENSKLRQVISILNGKLSSVTTIKPDTIKVPVTEIKTVVKEVSKPEKYIPKFYIYCTWLLIGLVVAVVAYLSWKIFKPRL